MPVMYDSSILPEHQCWQRGCRPEVVVKKDSKIIQSQVHGRFVVFGGTMYPISDFMRGPLCKPFVEVQKMAAFMSLWDNHDPAFCHSIIQSLEEDEQMKQHHTMVCIQIARVVPDESGD